MEKNLQVTIRSSIIFILTFAWALAAYGQNPDIHLLQDINSGRSDQKDKIWLAITNTAYPVAIGLPAGYLAAGLLQHDSLLTATSVEFTVAAGVNVILTYGLKTVVNRPRPYEKYAFIHPYQQEHDASFPSGHTSFAFNAATHLTLHTHKWYIAAPAYAWAAAVGYSRLYLGVHYPTDVLAGALIGAGSAWLEIKGNHWLHHKKHRIEQ